MEVIGNFIEAGASASIENGGAAKIADSAKFIDFLSAKSDDGQWEGSDLLYLVIDDIVRAMIIFQSYGQ